MSKPKQTKSLELSLKSSLFKRLEISIKDLNRNLAVSLAYKVDPSMVLKNLIRTGLCGR